MRYKHFKNADADISALTVGTWGIAGANSAGVTWGDVDTEESIAAIRQMIDNGVNMVDIVKKCILQQSLVLTSVITQENL